MRHRQEFLVEHVKLDQLISSGIDSYIKVVPESYHKTSLDLQDIPQHVIASNPKQYSEREVRVPYIALSKYHDSEIIRHQFIKTLDGYVSLDSQEELVDKDDGVWFYEKSSIQIEGKRYSIPRLHTQNFSINPRQIAIKDCTKSVYINKACLFIPAWYTTNIAHWLIDVLPRIYLAKKYLKIPLLLILPAAPDTTGLETLRAIDIHPDNIVWHNNNLYQCSHDVYNI